MRSIPVKNTKKKASFDPSSVPNLKDIDQVFYDFDCIKQEYSFLTPAVENLLGYTPAELEKIGFENIIMDEIEERINDYYINREVEEIQIKEKHVTYLIKTKNNSNKWIEDNSILIFDSDGNRNRRIGTLRDVGGYMREEKLRQLILEILETANSEKNLSELFRFIHSSVKKLMKADNFYIAYYKKDSDLLTFPYFVDELDDDSSSKRLGKGLTEYVLRTGKSILIDLKKDEELRRKGEIELIGPQSPIWLGIPLKIMDKTIGVLVLQDYKDANTYNVSHQQILDVISYPISRAIERKMLEEERKEMIVQLKEMNTSKDRLFSLISHDLRAPFNSLLGFAEILRTEFENLTTRDIKEYINVINDSSHTLYDMTNNLLHYSRLQLNKYDYIPKKVFLNQIIKDAIELLQFRIEKKRVYLKLELKEKYYVIGDEEMLITVFKNIISNSIKFSNRESTIRIFAEESTNETNNSSSIQISITDEGIGISEQNQKMIEAGVMFSTQGTEKEPGSGLGLLLSKKYIELNKGRLELISAGVYGTSVVITLQGLK
ncbi:MAG: ATP-binding protein [Ignavibacteriaceae bacterium]